MSQDVGYGSWCAAHKVPETGHIFGPATSDEVPTPRITSSAQLRAAQVKVAAAQDFTDIGNRGRLDSSQIACWYLVYSLLIIKSS